MSLVNALLATNNMRCNVMYVFLCNIDLNIYNSPDDGKNCYVNDDLICFI